MTCQTASPSGVLSTSMPASRTRLPPEACAPCDDSNSSPSRSRPATCLWHPEATPLRSWARGSTRRATHDSSPLPRRHGWLETRLILAVVPDRFDSATRYEQRTRFAADEPRAVKRFAAYHPRRRVGESAAVRHIPPPVFPRLPGQRRLPDQDVCRCVLATARNRHRTGARPASRADSP